MSEVGTQSYAQWVGIPIKNFFKEGNITIQGASLSWGKFYQGDKDNEISADTVNKTVIGPSQKDGPYSCGREQSPSGTEGTIDLYDATEKICTIYWNCPYAGLNKFEVRDKNSTYWVEHGNISPDGELGEVLVETGKKG